MREYFWGKNLKDLSFQVLGFLLIKLATLLKWAMMTTTIPFNYIINLKWKSLIKKGKHPAWWHGRSMCGGWAEFELKNQFGSKLFLSCSSHVFELKNQVGS